VAICHFDIRSISRGAGRSAIAAAAYRAGERLRDERTGLLHNYSRREDVNHKEILLPSHLRGGDAAWATDRASLWNAAERAEPRRNSRVAREYQVALPAELDAERRVQLARTFAQELAERHNVAVDLAVHAPRAEGDQRNHHAHLLVTTREVSASGLGPKTGQDMHSDERRRRGLPGGLGAIIAETKALRERWATLSNEAFAAAGLAVRIDHRSLRDRGIDREPAPRIPFAAFQVERRGQHSPIAQKLRERYRERLQARLARSQGMDLETVRRQAREAWLKLRAEAASPAGQQRSAAAERQRSAAAEQQRSGAALERDAADQDFSL
jgi:ATP-dependent exoDNAse (exonuclease V) alpha subunit